MARGPNAAQLDYGVLVGTVEDGALEPGGNSPHYAIWVVAGAASYRIAVNVRSVDGSDVLVHYDPTYADNATTNLAGRAAGPAGFTRVQTGPNGTGLDYVPDKLFPLADMHPLPPDGTGVTLQNLLDGQIERAKADTGAVVVAFGDFFADPGADATFGFSPE